MSSNVPEYLDWVNRTVISTVSVMDIEILEIFKKTHHLYMDEHYQSHYEIVLPAPDERIYYPNLNFPRKYQFHQYWNRESGSTEYNLPDFSEDEQPMVHMLEECLRLSGVPPDENDFDPESELHSH
ncbi:hypothetical protein PIB30_081901 [Stylosanthes scabra]|uniref:Uncharacterized protein n=1 Tax=Stylosanthes scabra TaxID=79078 RepID=A0ABU6QT54_9FABA|nr:hypothetical protein [Stylosanthes scabra]